MFQTVPENSSLHHHHHYHHPSASHSSAVCLGRQKSKEPYLNIIQTTQSTTTRPLSHWRSLPIMEKVRSCWLHILQAQQTTCNFHVDSCCPVPSPPHHSTTSHKSQPNFPPNKSENRRGGMPAASHFFPLTTGFLVCACLHMCSIHHIFLFSCDSSHSDSEAESRAT